MAYGQTNSRMLLQRRSNLSNMIQQALDGAAVIGITWILVRLHYGSIGGPT